MWHPTFDTYLGSYSVFRPYSYLFSYDYGSGVNAYNPSRDGFVRDALVIAVRLDYAAAANLNAYGSVFYARRTSSGYGWGCIAPHDSFFDGMPNDGNIGFSVNGRPGSPNIPDNELGYEIDAGFEWKLLEGWSANVLMGYWQPGKWFSYACIDRSVPNWNLPGAANFGTRPDRHHCPGYRRRSLLHLQFLKEALVRPYLPEALRDCPINRCCLTQGATAGLVQQCSSKSTSILPTAAAVIPGRSLNE